MLNNNLEEMVRNWSRHKEVGIEIEVIICYNLVPKNIFEAVIL